MGLARGLGPSGFLSGASGRVRRSCSGPLARGLLGSRGASACWSRSSGGLDLCRDGHVGGSSVEAVLVGKLWKEGLLQTFPFAVATMDSRAVLTFVFPRVASWAFRSCPGRPGLGLESAGPHLHSACGPALMSTCEGQAQVLGKWSCCPSLPLSW